MALTELDKDQIAYVADRMRRSILTCEALPDYERPGQCKSGHPEIIREIGRGDYSDEDTPVRFYEPTARDIGEYLVWMGMLAWLGRSDPYHGRRSIRIILMAARSLPWWRIAAVVAPSQSETSVRRWYDDAIMRIWQEALRRGYLGGDVLGDEVLMLPSRRVTLAAAARDLGMHAIYVAWMVGEQRVQIGRARDVRDRIAGIAYRSRRQVLCHSEHWFRTKGATLVVLTEVNGMMNRAGAIGSGPWVNCEPALAVQVIEHCARKLGHVWLDDEAYQEAVRGRREALSCRSLAG